MDARNDVEDVTTATTNPITTTPATFSFSSPSRTHHRFFNNGGSSGDDEEMEGEEEGEEEGEGHSSNEENRGEGDVGGYGAAVICSNRRYKQPPGYKQSPSFAAAGGLANRRDIDGNVMSRANESTPKWANRKASSSSNNSNNGGGGDNGGGGNGGGGNGGVSSSYSYNGNVVGNCNGGLATKVRTSSGRSSYSSRDAVAPPNFASSVVANSASYSGGSDVIGFGSAGAAAGFGSESGAGSPSWAAWASIPFQRSQQRSQKSKTERSMAAAGTLRQRSSSTSSLGSSMGSPTSPRSPTVMPKPRVSGEEPPIVAPMSDKMITARSRLPPLKIPGHEAPEQEQKPPAKKGMFERSIIAKLKPMMT
mmetsp:Transcript_27579/g.67832  ORF Transcript_27579/g.67832 Transcript_27579/m.67832 type:complete len:364 (+) Transcript_27579:34-1125(+)